MSGRFKVPKLPLLLASFLSFLLISLTSWLRMWPVFCNFFKLILIVYRYTMPFIIHNRMGHCCFLPFTKITFFFRIDLTCYDSDFQVSIFICLGSFQQQKLSNKSQNKNRKEITHHTLNPQNSLTFISKEAAARY